MHYRSLKPAEIAQLQAQFCVCSTWELVEVAENFSPENIHRVNFSGKIRLGIFDKEIVGKSGISKKAGIYDATLYNCELGDNVYISTISNHIANYKIGSESVIENVDLLEAYPQAVFGNGIVVNVLDETGSRKVKIFEKLTASTAYILSTFLHYSTAITAIDKLIDKFVANKTADMGAVGNKVVIRNCKTIIDGNIAEFATGEGLTLLKNGTISSDSEAKTFVGNAVIAQNFIIAKGAKVFDGAQLENCFVGEACQIGKGFSAMDSLFFANCEMLHGEAVATFAGPFTVSHHKSTLLIGGMFSFFNAGSGTNMSNHMYKLGPIHYGVMQRGSKMASDSYLMWPGKISTFSVVIGKVKKHIDTSALPFSYIIDNQGEYFIMPAMNITSVGTYRDMNKWITRDGRRNIDKLDALSLDSLSPYLAQQLQVGIETLSALKAKSPDASTYSFHGCKINAAFINKGISLYQMMIDIYHGDCLLQKNDTAEHFDKWIDLAGMLVPEIKVNNLLDYLVKGAISSVEDWNIALTNLFLTYQDYKEIYSEENKDTLLQAAIAANEKYKNLLLADAKKEFSKEIKICFGLDQNKDAKEAEFLAVRGEFIAHPIVEKIEKEFEEKMTALLRLK